MLTKVAITQRPPELLDLDASMHRALTDLKEAAKAGAQLIVFPEAFLPGYPTWVWRLKPGSDVAVGNQIHARLRASAVDLSKNGLKPLQDAAKENGVTLVMGFSEVDAAYSGSTLFNSVAIIGSDGGILNVHRKLMPTNPERMVWGQGDARGLRVVETPVGRIGALICWENYMPLARYAMYAQNIEIYVAPTWDCGDTWLASLRHIAKEGGCWVMSGSTALQGADVPADFPGRADLFSDGEWINPGDAAIVQPSGKVLAGPLHKEKGILFAEIDVEAARNSRKALDVTGHYARPDVFKLEVDRNAKPPVVFSSE
jgi:nitrilase